MSAQFTDDDLEKTVENANGETIGTVTAVEGDVAQVEPRDGVMDSIRAALGWTGTQETVSIRDDTVEEITDEVIRLETASLDADEAVAATTDEAEETEPADGEPDETARSAGLESDEAATQGSDTDPDGLEEGDRGESVEATGTSAETTATEEDLEDELNRGAKVEPPAESEVRETMEETTETAGGETAEMTDVPEELEMGDAYGDTPEADSTAEGAEVTEPSEPDELDRSESSGNADGTNAIDEPRGGEAFDADDITDDAEPGRTEDDESETVGDTERETEEMDLADELERGPDLESVDDTDDASEPSATEDVGDELTHGNDLESAAEPTEESTERPETEEMDLADEFDRGADLDAVEEDAPSAAPDRGVGEQPTEEMDLAEELDQGVDVESAAETDHEEDAPVDADAFPGPKADSEIAADAATPRSAEPASHAALEAEPALDHRTDEPARAPESVADEADRSGEERGGVESPIGAMFEAQQTAIEETRQLFEGSLAVQRDVNRIALNTLHRQMALQRQGIELFQSMTPDPVEAAKAMGPPKASLEDHQSTEGASGPSQAETGTLQRRTDSSESADREGTFERRLELVDGLDSMYRERLEGVGITTLDDLAYADVETVAEAAEVTEERAESWIEQAAA
ncbi:hypothetical protein CV102_08785 [Natronococcus pandeyae]|uniref:Helix-hairpin-helix domain-containing protein n=1 Tax=Natronococcus pandeyae TaxID=2055836 RepID=A0A8J8Q2S1_9EURY|nr:helix-hairpin-helix domain-containing protein [Natronococcus pandeyae]TYL39356.1 hypothetical protein CV102_08785 [Natronococcus pandeyae]